MPESSNSPFSESFHAKHRLTLIASCVLLVVSLPNVDFDATQDVIGFKVTKLAAHTAEVMLLFVALYAFVAFAAEWLEEVYPYFLRRNGLLADTSDAVRANSKEIMNHVTKIEVDAEQIRLAAARICVREDRPLYLTAAAIDKAKMEFIKEERDEFFLEMMRTLNFVINEAEKKVTGFESYREHIDIGDTRELIGEQIDRAFMNWLGKPLLKSHYETFRLGEQFQTDVKALNSDLKAAVKEIRSKHQTLHRLNRRILCSQKQTFFRAWGLYGLFPTAVFLTALMHCLGELWRPLLPSLIIWLGS